MPENVGHLVESPLDLVFGLRDGRRDIDGWEFSNWRLRDVPYVSQSAHRDINFSVVGSGRSIVLPDIGDLQGDFLHFIFICLDFFKSDPTIIPIVPKSRFYWLYDALAPNTQGCAGTPTHLQHELVAGTALKSSWARWFRCRWR